MIQLIITHVHVHFDALETHVLSTTHKHKAHKRLQSNTSVFTYTFTGAPRRTQTRVHAQIRSNKYTDAHVPMHQRHRNYIYLQKTCIHVHLFSASTGIHMHTRLYTKMPYLKNTKHKKTQINTCISKAHIHCI